MGDAGRGLALRARSRPGCMHMNGGCARGCAMAQAYRQHAFEFR